MTATQTLTWFAAHELRLAWRDWATMMAGGRTTRERLVTGIVLLLVLGLHWLAWAILKPVLAEGVEPDLATLVVLTGTLLTTFSMMLSQSIEHVTRAFYARADMDLILSSPAPARHLFTVRIVSVAMTGALMTALLVSPFVNVAAIIDGPRWLSAYAVVAALSALSTGIALALAMVLFRTLGPKRTRVVAQVVAAIVGAALLIAIQAVAVMTYGNLSRMSVLTSPELLASVPGVESPVWLPPRALLGEAGAGLTLLAASLAVLALSVVRYSGRFSSQVIAAAGTSVETHGHAPRRAGFRALGTARALRAKEWALLARDPWLVSQTLMQVLYLIPPALLLWRDMGTGHSIHVILAPVLVMAFGQLAGGLSWLAISGEDAPDLVATAPVSMRAVTRAKIEAVLAVIIAGAAPFLLAMSLLSVRGAAATAAGIAAASASAILIQLWFRSAAKRSQFRRRQVASRAATFSEAFSSVFWAGAAGFAAAGSWAALGFVALALIVLPVTWWIRPRS
jgi:ABC-2 type transport system permease protein